MTLTKEQIIDKMADEFLWYLIPFDSMDIMHLIKKAYYLDISPRELADILYEQAEEMDISLFDNNNTTVLNTLFNDYILRQARADIDEVLNIDLYDYNIYLFANYSDDPLQYSNGLVEDIEQAIKEHEATRADFDEYAQYILDKMGIELED